jgi:hypothetical protein
MEDAVGPSAVGLLSLLILTASVSLPKLVVPNFRDLTIKTRRTAAGGIRSEETLFLKGPRQRGELVSVGASAGKAVTITQCDQKLRLNFNEKDRTYASFPIEDWSERMKRARPQLQFESTGKDVNVTIDTVDTGKRRQFGSFEARRIKTTTTVEPQPGAVMLPSVTEVEGWYIDLPGLGCAERENKGAPFAYLTVASGERGKATGKQDNIIIKRLGTAPRGYALEETSRRTESGRTTVTKIELLEFSETPLDTSLFELPAGYRPALRTPYGGYDMTKPDTLANRVQAYWEAWTVSVRRWFR